MRLGFDEDNRSALPVSSVSLEHAQTRLSGTDGLSSVVSASRAHQLLLCPATVARSASTPPAGTPQPKWAVPRETAALPLSGGDGALLSGISAYAFQGTNAHALVARAPQALPNTSRPAAASWQREGHWVGSPVHPLLHSCRLSGAGSPRRAALQLDCQLSGTPRLSFHWDHRVGGRVLFPGTAFFELATAAAKAASGRAGAASVALLAAAIPAPLQLPEGRHMKGQVAVVLRVSVRLGTGALAVASSPAAFRQQHLTANAVVTGSVDALLGSVPQATGHSARSLFMARFSMPAQAAGCQAPAYAGIDNAACASASHFHPASLDACLQLAAAVGSALKVPAALGCLHVPDRLASPQLAAASWQQGGAVPADAPSLVEYWLTEPAGGFGLGLASLELRPMGKLPPAGKAAAGAATAIASSAASAAEQLLYEVAWPAAAPAGNPGSAFLPATGLRTAATVDLLPRGDIATPAGAIAALQAAQLESLGGAQLITCSAVPAASASLAGTAGHAAESALPGLMRSLALEFQGQRFASLDGDRLAPPRVASQGTRLALMPAGATPLAADGYGAAQRGAVEQRAALLPAKARSGIPAFHLMPRPRGALSSLKPEPVATADVAPGQVLMAVKAVGVNFRRAGGA